MLLKYLMEPETAQEAEEERQALRTAADSGGFGGLIRSAASVELHCHNVRALAFAGSGLFSASDEEVAQWELPLM